MRVWSLIVAAALVFGHGANFPAKADIVIYTDMVPPLGIVGPTSSSQTNLDFEYAAMIPKFDASLGTLTSVEFALEFTVSFVGTVLNGDVAHLELPIHSKWDNGFESLLPQGILNAFILGPQNFSQNYNFGAATGPLTDSSLLSAVAGMGSGSFEFFDVNSQLEIHGGLATADLMEGLMTVIYTYSAVPEAEAWLMFSVVATAVACANVCRRRFGRRR